MPALFIPPLAPAIQSNLVTAYPEEPEVIQGQPSERVETITLVLNYGGQVALPGTVAWRGGTPKPQQIEQVEIEPLVLDIEGPAPQAVGRLFRGPVSRLNTETLIWWLLAGVLLAGLLWRWLPGYLAARQGTGVPAYEQSEAHAFALLS